MNYRTFGWLEKLALKVVLATSSIYVILLAGIFIGAGVVGIEFAYLEVAIFVYTINMLVCGISAGVYALLKAMIKYGLIRSNQLLPNSKILMADNKA